MPSGYASGDTIGEPFALGKHLNSFGEDASGEIYIVTLDGTLWHLVGD